MAANERSNPDQRAAALVAEVLRAHGFTVDLLAVDDSGVRVSAHRPTEKHHHLDGPGYEQLTK